MITAEHSSGRFDVGPATLKAALAKQLADDPDFLSLTEMMSEARAAVLNDFPAYDVARAIRRADGADECALLVGPRHRIVSAQAVRLSALPIPRRGGKLCYALHVVVEDVTTGHRHHRIVIHMPSGVEGLNWIRANEQGDVFKDAIRGLRRLVADLPGRVVITGDWNLSLRRPWVRKYFAKQFPQFTPTWPAGQLPDVGTHGARVIDFSLVRGFSVPAAQVVPSFGASDHRAIRETHKEITMSRTPKTDALIAALRRRGVEVLEHDDWGSQHQALYRARLDTRPHGLLPGQPVDTLWNHITVTNDDGPLIGDFKADCREVERIGFERFGSGVSYNILVDRNATRPRVALGQFLEVSGAHTVNDKGTPGYSFNQNKVALAVAWVGVPGNQINEHGRAAIVHVNAALIEVGAMTEHYDNVPHSLVAAKDCPTDELRNQLPAIKRDALAVVKPVTAAPTRNTPRWDLIWETANAIVQSAPDDTDPDLDDKDDVARRIRTLAARYSTKH